MLPKKGFLFAFKFLGLKKQMILPMVLKGLLMLKAVGKGHLEVW